MPGNGHGPTWTPCSNALKRSNGARGRAALLQQETDSLRATPRKEVFVRADGLSPPTGIARQEVCVPGERLPSDCRLLP